MTNLTTFKIEGGQYKGTYQIDTAGKIRQIGYTGTGVRLITVGRGTARHKAATEALAD